MSLVAVRGSCRTPGWLLRALADRTGLTGGLSRALARRGFVPLHDRGRVLVDLAVAIADGAAVISDFAVLAGQREVLGPVASVPTVWRALEEIAGGGKVTARRVTAAVSAARRCVGGHRGPARVPAWRAGGGQGAAAGDVHPAGCLGGDLPFICTWHTFLTGRPPASWSDASLRRVAVLKVTLPSVRWHLNSQGWKKVTVAGDGLRLVLGGAVGTELSGLAADPVTFQDGCLLAFEASQVARGFSRTSMDNGAGVLERFLAACGRPAWDVTREDVDRVVAGLSAQGLAASTRRVTCRHSRGSTRSLSRARRARSRRRSGSGWSTRSMSSTRPGMSARTPRR